MPVNPDAKVENRLLQLLPRDEYRRLAPLLDSVMLTSKQVLYEPGAPIAHVYFPNSGVLSWLSVLSNGNTVEVATIGSEGMSGVRVFLGVDTTPVRTMVQVPGHALRLASADLKAAMRRDSSMSRILHRYVGAFLIQLTQSVACNTHHPLSKRLCRWLLMTHDRVRSDQFPLTHELLSQMLGVRRASVTEAARKLQAAKTIRYTHGKITVLDRAALEAASCECYQAVKRDYDALLP